MAMAMANGDGDGEWRWRWRWRMAMAMVIGVGDGESWTKDNDASQYERLTSHRSWLETIESLQLIATDVVSIKIDPNSIGLVRVLH